MNYVGDTDTGNTTLQHYPVDEYFYLIRACSKSILKTVVERINNKNNRLFYYFFFRLLRSTNNDNARL